MTLRMKHAGMMQSGGFRLQPFTIDELNKLHSSTMEIMQYTGLYVQHAEARQILAKAGCDVNEKTFIVKFLPHLVEDAIRTAPSQIVLAGRTPDRDISVGGNRVAFTNFGEGITYTDPETNEVRATSKEDLGNITRLLDSLDIISVLERAVGSQDYPAQVAALHNYEAIVNNSTKHLFMGPDTAKMMDYILKVAEIAVGGPEIFKDRCPVSFITCPVSPLRLVKDTCEIIMAAAKHNVCVNILSMAMGGGSAPVNLAGTLINHNAEILGGITLSQLCRPGAKVIYGSSTTAINLKGATACVGSPELAMINAAVASLAQFYKLPSWTAGG